MGRSPPSQGITSGLLCGKHIYGARAHRECTGCLLFREVSSAQQLLQHLRHFAEIDVAMRLVRMHGKTPASGRGSGAGGRGVNLADV